MMICEGRDGVGKKGGVGMSFYDEAIGFIDFN